MTIINNFNTNSNGPDIKFSGFYDSMQSQIDFLENFEIVVQESYRKTAIYFYNPYGQIEQNLDIKVKAYKKELYIFVDNHVNCGVDKSWSKAELYDDALSFLEDELTHYKYDIDELQKEYGLEISFINDIEIISTRGYSQGDYALVVIDKTQLAKLWGKYPDSQECIDHYFWDCPVWARLNINGAEYAYHDYDLTFYNWDKEGFIKGVAKDAGIAIEALQDLVPDDLPYCS